MLEKRLGLCKKWIIRSYLTSKAILILVNRSLTEEFKPSKKVLHKLINLNLFYNCNKGLAKL